MERNLLLFLRFDGRGFCGWQVQKKGLPTVMETLQNALEAVLGHRPAVKGCSRTDAGVSALEYGVSFRTENRIPCEKLPIALNIKLPDTVAVVRAIEVPADFHARYDCRGKEYCYRVRTTTIPDPFQVGLVYHLPYPFDAVRLDGAAAAFVGTHDFAAFQNAGSKMEDTVRTIAACRVTQHGDLLEILVRGDGFLYNMVRIMAGTLLEIGRGKIPPEALPEIIASCDRSRAGFTAPACGLLLQKVFFDENIR